MLKYVTVFHEENDLHEEWVLSTYFFYVFLCFLDGCLQVQAHTRACHTEDKGGEAEGKGKGRG